MSAHFSMYSYSIRFATIQPMQYVVLRWCMTSSRHRCTPMDRDNRIAPCRGANTHTADWVNDAQSWLTSNPITQTA